jgi:galactose mutarotase-like enzyme
MLPINYTNHPYLQSQVPRMVQLLEWYHLEEEDGRPHELGLLKRKRKKIKADLNLNQNTMQLHLNKSRFIYKNENLEWDCHLCPTDESW